MKRFFLCSIPLLLPCFSSSAAETVVFDAPQMAGISGLREMWNEPVVLSADGAKGENPLVDKRFGVSDTAHWLPSKRDGSPGPIIFDAVHRSLMVSFPAAIGRIVEEAAKGNKVTKAELVLSYQDIELWPEGYALPGGMSFLGDQWVKDQPRWHAVAWALRQPWEADPELGPTYNASVKGKVYWANFGATDESKDRFPKRFGPSEISSTTPEARLDVTDVLANPEFGKTLGDRLSVLRHGFLVKKEEIYDVKGWLGGYEWGTARGPQGIFIGTPKLAVTFDKGTVEKIAPSAVTFDFNAWLKSLPAQPVGAPTAVLPTEAEFQKLADRFKFQRPAWMKEDWQWTRVQELESLGGGEPFPATYEAYLKWIDEQLGRAPRSWNGFDAPNLTEAYFKYQDALPSPVREHWKLYWWSWLMPDRAYDGFAFNGQTQPFAQGYIGQDQAKKYYEETGDWRGDFSVYRTYVRAQGTMNFNHWSAAAVLLGGKILGSEAMIKEGRQGLEGYPLRLWSWADGSTQESIDHYYFGLSLKSQKVFEDFGPSITDRLIGSAMLLKSIEELASNFHPGLRRFSSGSGRTGIAYVLGTQDGTAHILHTLSPSGTLTDMGEKSITAPNVTNLPVIGNDLLPGDVARQTLNGSWAPTWFSNIIDGKKLPAQYTATYNSAGSPRWRRSYLGEKYSLASTDITDSDTVPVLAQWRREPKKVSSMVELGTLIVRGGVNRTEMLDSVYHGTAEDHKNPNGIVGAQGLQNVAMQDKNRMIVLSSPLAGLPDDGSGRDPLGEVTSVQSTIGLFNFKENPLWAIYINDKKVSAFPAKATFKDRITIHDGVSYVALLPIEATNLGRDTEILISNDIKPTRMQGGDGEVREALRIDAFIYRSDKPLDKARPDLDSAYCGWVIEMGDQTEYPSFEAFQDHIKKATLTVGHNERRQTIDLTYRTGTDNLTLAYNPLAGSQGNSMPVFPVRSVNGKWPYLPPGIDRDSAVSQMGRAGHLEKLDASLDTEPGRMAFLLNETQSGHVIALNPFSEATLWRLTLPGGAVVTANGRVGMARMAYNSKTNSLEIDTGESGDPAKEIDLATGIAISSTKPLKVLLNGQSAQPVEMTLGSARAQVFAIKAPIDPKTFGSTWQSAQSALKKEFR